MMWRTGKRGATSMFTTLLHENIQSFFVEKDRWKRCKRWRVLVKKVSGFSKKLGVRGDTPELWVFTWLWWGTWYDIFMTRKIQERARSLRWATAAAIEANVYNGGSEFTSGWNRVRSDDIVVWKHASIMWASFMSITEAKKTESSNPYHTCRWLLASSAHESTVISLLQ
jgi:hypothetical protein